MEVTNYLLTGMILQVADRFTCQKPTQLDLMGM